MREIIFRGKRVDNGEWVFGFYVYTNERHRIIYEDYEGFYCEDEIIPETVGQYTGLKDRNGVMIFEGDEFERNGHIGTVKWIHDGWGARFDDGKIVPLSDNLKWDWSLNKKEIIGNIHEEEKK